MLSEGKIAAERSGEALPDRQRRLGWRAPVHVQRALGQPQVRPALFDGLVLTLAMVATHLSAAPSGNQPPPLGWSVAFVFTALIALAAAGVYRPRINVQFLDDLRGIVAATAIAAMAISFVRVIVSDDINTASQEVRAWLFAATYLTAARAGFRLVQARRRREGLWAEPTLIVGAGRVGRQVAGRLDARPEFGLRPVAFLDDDPLQLEDEPPLPVIGVGGGDSQALAARLESAINDLDIKHVILTFSLASHEQELAVVRSCLENGVSVLLIPRLFEGVPDQTRLERLGGIPLISVHPSDPRSWQFEVKYALDRVFAAIAILLASPLLLFAAIGTLLTLGRPILFRQPRIGIDGREFDMLKFRTMRPPEDPADNRFQEALERDVAPGGVEGEDRRTRFGSFLRSSSIDELPQLLNVLRGEMSMIGPRPERPEFVERFEGEVHRYSDRLRVKSGITGWAQIHGLRGKTSLADRVEWDNYYIENWSPWLDLKIVFGTVLAVFRDRSE
jgi:exopolysaccharide biosynthesis polyprenyl glycosylphosphotransferase